VLPGPAPEPSCPDALSDRLPNADDGRSLSTSGHNHAPYYESVLELAKVDLEQIAAALEDQTDYDHRWLIDPRTGEIHFWTSDTGIDGEKPIDLDELDLLPIDPVSSRVWYRDMVDFAEAISNAGTGRRLARALEGKGAFRRFKNEL
jgi:hypothetical protein